MLLGKVNYAFHPVIVCFLKVRKPRACMLDGRDNESDFFILKVKRTAAPNAKRVSGLR